MDILVLNRIFLVRARASTVILKEQSFLTNSRLDNCKSVNRNARMIVYYLNQVNKNVTWDILLNKTYTLSSRFVSKSQL